METLESSRVCRLCGQHSGISINIFDTSENHVRKINAVLPIMVHEMDLLPKQMCHRCSYKLEEFHKFYMNCLKTDAALKSQLSWMRKGGVREKVGVPMVHIENMKEIKAEPLDYDVYELEPLVENIDYINSMNSVTFPADSIHNGLTYTTFSRCCCDKKDQSRSRRTSELCQNYQGQMPRCGRIANVSQKKTFEDAAQLKSIKRNLFTQSVFPDCPQNRLQHVENVVENTVENVRDCLVTVTSTKDATPETRNHCHGKLGTLLKNQPVTRNTIVRNLRPRKNLNYAQVKHKKTRSSINPRPSTLTKSNVSEAISYPNVELMRHIKVELIEESKGRNLRPRRNVVDYQESKIKKVSDYRSKKRKLDEESSKLCSKNDSTSNALDFKIKQETLYRDLENTMLSETTNTTPQLPSKFLPAKIEAMTSHNSISLQDDYLKSQFRVQLTEQKSFSNIVRNRLAKAKKVLRVNYSPKYLRSQDIYLRNGKIRNNTEWSVKKLQTRKLTNTVNKNTKKSPMLKLSENIKHYCESCNVRFINKELFRLHACYYD
ncbi:PREDICTED: uncharacterized protein LOC108777453 [Cyphomyrmex costatus]|uniref:ZAD domain-containing protein n=1 Tax=Cyphomyrmex costatus TaxID=456900 RepID=A0A195CEY2_9HYME|nr:PREDICTED: uncharacterized protein LOC108777453 [Cyphomyrmex costatus]KYM98618.1 hypothetical protein ALC62_10586 [Cyphomyrmex costatus]